MSASNALPTSSMQTPLPTAPVGFDGTVAELVEEVMAPVLPDVDAVRRFHAALVEMLDGPAPVYLVRAVTGLERRGVHATDAGTAFLAGDNSPPWWLHALLLHGVLPVGPLGPVLEALPRHLHDAGGIAHCNAAGWHLAHLLAAKDGDTAWRSWGDRELTRRLVRNLHPCNHFFVPKTDWQRVGADPDVLAYVAWVFRRRHRAVWSEFLALAGGRAPRASRSAGAVRIRLEPSAPGRARPRSRGTAPGGRVLGMHFVCRGDMNVRDFGDGTFESGVWKVARQHADTVETLALHESKDRRSYRHGRVLGWRPVDIAGQERIVFHVRQEGPPQAWRGGGSGEKGYRREGDTGD